MTLMTERQRRIYEAITEPMTEKVIADRLKVKSSGNLTSLQQSLEKMQQNQHVQFDEAQRTYTRGILNPQDDPWLKLAQTTKVEEMELPDFLDATKRPQRTAEEEARDEERRKAALAKTHEEEQEKRNRFKKISINPPKKEPAPSLKAKTPKAERTPRPSREGLTPIATVAEEFGHTAKDARGLLRSINFPKPPQGWAFPAKDLPSIRAALKKALEQRGIKRPSKKVDSTPASLPSTKKPSKRQGIKEAHWSGKAKSPAQRKAIAEKTKATKSAKRKK